MQAFDYDAFKRGWRALAGARGVNPLEGPTSYQVVEWKADEARRTHYERLAELVRQHARTHTPEDCIAVRIRERGRNGIYTWRLVHYRYGNWDDGYSRVDGVKVDRQASRLWWAWQGLWGQRQARFDSAVLRPTEVVAIAVVNTLAREIQADLRSKEHRAKARLKGLMLQS